LRDAAVGIAVSVLSGREVRLEDGDLDALLAVPMAEWVQSDDERLRRLAEHGLLVSDSAEPALAELRQRDEQLGANGWFLYAALYHSLTRRHGLDLELAEDLDEKRRAKAATAIATRTARGGPPPAHFHSAPGTKAVHELPLDEPSGELYDLLRRRRTVRGYEPDATMSLAQLSTVLRTVFGCTGTVPIAEGFALQKKTSPSGGALHPTEAYPLIRRVEGIAPGLYHYNVERHALELLEELTEDEATEYLRRATCGQAHFQHAQVAFVLTSRFRRNFWKYWAQRDQYGVLLLDAGHLSQTLYLVATELGLDAFVTAIVNHDDIGERLGLDRFDEGVLAICGCGIAAPESGLRPRFRPFTPLRQSRKRGPSPSP
jgi:putative peptide maturation dehydrogenase